MSRGLPPGRCLCLTWWTYKRVQWTILQFCGGQLQFYHTHLLSNLLDAVTFYLFINYLSVSTALRLCNSLLKTDQAPVITIIFSLSNILFNFDCFTSCVITSLVYIIRFTTLISYDEMNWKCHKSYSFNGHIIVCVLYRKTKIN